MAPKPTRGQPATRPTQVAAPRLDRAGRRLAKLRELIATLPATSATPMGDHLTFRVEKKTFAWYLNNHHGDGLVAICCKSTLARQAALVAQDADRYRVPAYVGRQGWVSARLDLPRVDWDVVFDLVTAAYRMQAPRRVLRKFE